MEELIASSPILAAFAAIPAPYLWMILIGSLMAMVEVRWTALVLIIFSMVALLRNNPVGAEEIGTIAVLETAGYQQKRYGGYGYAARGPFMPFQQGYRSRTKRMQQESGAPHVMYNGGYRDTRSRFQPN